MNVMEEESMVGGKGRREYGVGSDFEDLGEERQQFLCLCLFVSLPLSVCV